MRVTQFNNFSLNQYQTDISRLFHAIILGDEENYDPDRFTTRDSRCHSLLDGTLVITDMLIADAIDQDDDDDLMESVEELDSIEQELFELYQEQGINISQNKDGDYTVEVHKSPGFILQHIRSDQSLTIVRTFYAY